MRKHFWLLGLLLPLAGHAAGIPEPVLPAGVGVNIHFVTGHERDLDLIRTAGFRFIRMDFGWEGIEKQKGHYDWSAYDKLLSNLEQRGMRPVFILDYSHHLYEEAVTNENPVTHLTHRTTASPQHPDSVAAFASWAVASAKHYHGRHIIWEIWNEPNISFWNPKPDVQQYTTLALATCRAIRAAEPDATIVGPASSTFPWDFLESFLKSGVLEYLDAVSVHPYREPRRPPEIAAADYQRLRELIERYAPVAKKDKIPILSGEWGYSTWTRGVSLETQAAFAARQQLSNLLNGVPLSIWCDWKNDGDDPKENEHNFGTVLPDLNPKPAYRAIQTLTRELSGYRITRRRAPDDQKDYLLVCTDAKGAQKLVAWTLGEPHQVAVTVNGAQTLSAVDSAGQALMLKLDGNRAALDLTSAPQYIPLGTGTVEEP
ncbi:MAG TPA: cellulase family glycosylhydrolase [Candidatus Acidoferrum sp.]|nr:cellulase family glycosylhydrolase [Candidatus Acidoferrum sp.]